MVTTSTSGLERITPGQLADARRRGERVNPAFEVQGGDGITVATYAVGAMA